MIISKLKEKFKFIPEDESDESRSHAYSLLQQFNPVLAGWEKGLVDSSLNVLQTILNNGYENSVTKEKDNSIIF